MSSSPHFDHRIFHECIPTGCDFCGQVWGEADTESLLRAVDTGLEIEFPSLK